MSCRKSSLHIAVFLSFLPKERVAEPPFRDFYRVFVRGLLCRLSANLLFSGYLKTAVSAAKCYKLSAISRPVSGGVLTVCQLIRRASMSSCCLASSAVWSAGSLKTNIVRSALISAFGQGFGNEIDIGAGAAPADNHPGFHIGLRCEDNGAAQFFRIEVQGQYAA